MLRLGDILQYFLGHFWNFKNVDQIRYAPPLFCNVEILQHIQENLNHFKQILFYMSQPSENPRFVTCWEVHELKTLKSVFAQKTKIVFLLYDGPNTASVSERFKSKRKSTMVES